VAYFASHLQDVHADCMCCIGLQPCVLCCSAHYAPSCAAVSACSEFATQYPLAGGAYNYISLTMGELAAW
jgi:hypothetical protein